MRPVLAQARAFRPSKLPGLLAYWDFTATTTNLPNRASSPAPTEQILPCSRYGMSSSGFTIKSGTTVTEDYGVAPDGFTPTTRIVAASGTNKYIQCGSMGLPAGTYTMTCKAKSNDGTTPKMRLGHTSGTWGSDVVVGASETLIGPFTFTVGSALTNVYLGNGSDAPALDVAVWDWRLYPGSSAPSDDPPNFEATPHHITTKRPSRTSAGATFVAASLQSIAATPRAAKLLRRVTVYAVGIQNAVTAYAPFLSNISSSGTQFGLHSSFTQNTTAGWPKGYFGGIDVDAKCSHMRGGVYHVMAMSYDGVTLRLYMDGVLVAYKSDGTTASLTTTLRQLLFGTNIGVFGSLTESVAAIYTEAHSADQVGQMTGYLRDYVKARAGVTFASGDKLLITEGDSITYGTSATNAIGWASLVAENLIASGVQGRMLAVQGASITGSNSPTNRLPQLKESIAGVKRSVMTLLIGANDLANATTTGAVDTFIASTKAYATSAFTAGVGRIVFCTMLPRVPTAGTQSGWYALRDYANGFIRTDPQLGGHPRAFVADFAADATMGADGSQLSATYYDGIGLHPLDAGYAILAPIAQVAIEAAFASF